MLQIVELLCLLCVYFAGTYVTQVTATDADDPTYGNSAKIVYSILQGQPYFSVDSKTGAFTPTSLEHPQVQQCIRFPNSIEINAMLIVVIYILKKVLSEHLFWGSVSDWLQVLLNGLKACLSPLLATGNV